MTDTDEIRVALSDALRLPGEVRPRPGAATTIRARARSRRRASVASFAVAAPASFVIVALLLTNGSGQRSASVPATGITATPSADSTSGPAEVTVPGGPRMLAKPIVIRPVLQEYLTCPAQAQTVPATDGSRCYRLGPAAMVIRRVRDLSTSLAMNATGTTSSITALDLTMTEHDTSAWSALTAQLLHEQVALVVSGTVRTAPTIQSRITGGIIQIPLDAGAAQALVTELTG